MIENIPQGLVQVDKGETPAQAAIRETIEETGHTPLGLVAIGRVGFDIGNSESLMPFFLAYVPYLQQPAEQQLESTEQIEKARWYTWRELEVKGSIDAKTMSGLFLARRILQPELL